MLAVLLVAPPRTAVAQSGAGDLNGSWCRHPTHYIMPGDLSDAAFEVGRLADITGAAPSRSYEIRRVSAYTPIGLCPNGGLFPASSFPTLEPRGLIEVRVLPARWDAFVNTAYPVDWNNGAVWAGRGFSMGLHAGVQLRAGPISAAAYPTLLFQQNLPFEINPVRIPGLSPYAYVGHPYSIDWPQRFGQGPFGGLDPGQSYVRIDAFGFGIGVSTENLWYGPARRNPILLGNTAGGFPHIFIGTSRPVDIGIGKVEGDAFWAKLSESQFFDTDASNDTRELAGFAAVYSPRWLPGLHLGLARVKLSNLPLQGIPFKDFLLNPYREVRTNVQFGSLADDQMLSLFARWSMPGAGFEGYGEWARNDHWQDNDDLITEPDHSQAYTLGFQKLVELSGKRWLRVQAELTHLERTITLRSRGIVPVYYIHHEIRQGYTQKGQLLGAPIGPGSDAQYLGIDLLKPWGHVGVFGQRVRRDVDGYYDRWVDLYAQRGYDVEMTGGVTFLVMGDDLDVRGQLAIGNRKNRDFIGHDQLDWSFLVETNLGLELAVAWRPHLVLPFF